METQALESPHVGLREWLLEDHRRLETVLDRVLRAFEANDRQRIQSLWTELDAALTAHLDAEDRELLPVLGRTHDREARSLIEEHRHIRTRLIELAAAVDLHAIRVEMVRRFIDELRAHARHEDRVAYRWAQEHLDDEQSRPLLEAIKSIVLRKERGAAR